MLGLVVEHNPMGTRGHGLYMLGFLSIVLRVETYAVMNCRIMPLVTCGACKPGAESQSPL